MTEATLTFPIPHWEKDEVFSAEEIVRATEHHLAGRFATIHTVEGVLNSLNLKEHT